MDHKKGDGVQLQGLGQGNRPGIMAGKGGLDLGGDPFSQLLRGFSPILRREVVSNQPPMPRYSAVVATLHRTIASVRRVNRQGATIRGLDLEMIVNAATADVRDVHTMALHAHISGVNVIHHDVERYRATLGSFPGAQDEMRTAAQLEDRKVLLGNNGANAEFDEEICAPDNVANQQSDVTNGNIWTRIVHHGSPDEWLALTASDLKHRQDVLLSSATSRRPRRPWCPSQSRF
jgi:hypothetical protein